MYTGRYVVNDAVKALRKIIAKDNGRKKLLNTGMADLKECLVDD